MDVKHAVRLRHAVRRGDVVTLQFAVDLTNRLGESDVVVRQVEQTYKTVEHYKDTSH